MTDVRAVQDLLEDHPEAEATLREFLDREESVPFDAVPADSGLFGEIVSSGTVEKTGEGDYRLADRDVVRAAVERESVEYRTDGESSSTVRSFVERVGDVDRTLVAGLLGTLALVVAFRTWHLASVYRKGDIVLLGNDPYYYRYWVERVVESGDLGVGSLPQAVANGEPLLVTTLARVTAVLGGSAETAGHVLAWYPVVSAALTASLVYLLAVELFEDRRIGLASVALLAVTPAHAYRSALGFADHHAFDYPWLVATALALTLLVGTEWEDLREWRTWLWVGALGIIVAGQTLSWDAAPILLAPIGIVVAVSVAVAVREDRSPVTAVAPIAAGLAGATVVTHAVHTAWGWHSDPVVYAPGLLLFGVAVVGSIGWLGGRLDRPARDVVIAEGVLGVTATAAAFRALPSYADRLVSRLEFLFGAGGIAETSSIVGGEMGSIIGPILIFGFVFFLGIPYLVWAGWRIWQGGRSVWLPSVIYGVYFTVLATIQLRFAGELSPVLAVFAGLGFVHVASTVDLAGRPVVLGGASRDGRRLSLPNRGTAVSIIVLFLLVASWGLVQTGVKASQLTIDDSDYDAAQWMEEDADRRNLSTDERYVFSEWGRNRLYNYFVSGQSHSYGYARQHYRNFTRSAPPGTDWFSRLSERDTAYVVTEELPGTAPATMQSTLQRRLGSDADGADGTGRFRGVWRSEDGSRTVFRPIEGGRIVGRADPGTTVSVETDVTVGDRTASYRRQDRANPYGVYATRVAYPGSYRVGGREVGLDEAAVTEGRTTTLHNRSGVAHWPFDRMENGRAFDRVGGHTARVNEAEPAPGFNDTGLSFDGTGDSVTANVSVDGPFTVSLWIRPSELDTTERNDYRDLVRTDRGSILILEENGAVSFRMPGIDNDPLRGGHVAVDEWTHVVATYNGTHRSLSIDGSAVRSETVSAELQWGQRLRVGNRFRGTGDHVFAGRIDSVWIGTGDQRPPGSEGNRS